MTKHIITIATYTFLFTLVFLNNASSYAQDTLSLKQGYTLTVIDTSGKKLNVEELYTLAIGKECPEAATYFNRAWNNELVSYAVLGIGGSIAGYSLYNLIVGENPTTNLVAITASLGISLAVDFLLIQKRYNKNISQGVAKYNEAIRNKSLRTPL